MKKTLTAYLVLLVVLAGRGFGLSHLNEFSSSPDTLQWVELTNPDTVPLVISGWQILTSTSACVLNCTIPAGGYLVVDSAKLAGGTIGSGSFRLNPNRDHIILTGADEKVLYPATPTDRYHSYTPPVSGSAAFYDQDSNSNWYIDSTPTPGQANDNWSAVTGQLTGAPDTVVTLTLTGISGIFRIGVAPGDSFIVRGLGPGSYIVSACANWQRRTYQDTFRGQLAVGYAQTRSGVVIGMARNPWDTREPVPGSGYLKTVRDGGCMAYLSPHVYLLKGHKSLEFYGYDPAQDRWTQQPDIPLGGGRTVAKGGAMTAIAGRLYGCKGNNTSEFFRYDPASGWWRMADVPGKVKGGSGLASALKGDTACVFLLRGTGTLEFWRYNILSNSWQSSAPAPTGVSGKTFRDGSCLTSSDDGHRIYALKGNYNEFYAYATSTGLWSTLACLPFIGRSGRKRKVDYGAALTFAFGSVYALKGSKTLEFWRFDITAGTWSQLPDLTAGQGRGVCGGGALAFSSSDTAIYAVKGNNTLEFYRYGLSAGYENGEVRKPKCESQHSSPVPHPLSLVLRISPNPVTNATTITYTLPGPAACRLSLYDITGKLVTTLASGHHTDGTSSFIVHRSSLSAGIYILRLETENTATTSKLTIE